MPSSWASRPADRPACPSLLDDVRGPTPANALTRSTAGAATPTSDANFTAWTSRWLQSAYRRNAEIRQAQRQHGPFGTMAISRTRWQVVPVAMEERAPPLIVSGSAARSALRTALPICQETCC